MATRKPGKPTAAKKTSKPAATRKPSKPAAARKPSKPKELSKDKVMQHFDELKKDILALKTKIGMTKKSDITKLSEDVSNKVSDSASEIMKSSADVLHKATKVMQFAAAGAVEGGKKALKEDKKPKPRRTATRAPRKTSKKAKS